MEPTTDLRAEIKALIEPWADSVEEPPFRQKQLIMMALALHEQPLRSRQILEWMVSTFDYYKATVCAAFWEEFHPLGNRSPPALTESNDEKTFMAEQYMALQDYDFPIIETSDDDTRESYWSTTTATARIYLQELLATEPKGAFRFVDLPPELRTKIYEMALRYPPSGLRFTYGRYYHDPSADIAALTRDFSVKFSMTRWTHPSDTLTVCTLPNTLRLLLVNKQMFEEAVYCFYSVNSFWCPETQDFSQLLRALAPTRRQHLRHIAFHYTPFGMMSPPLDAFNILASLPQLKRLGIFLDESYCEKKEDGVYLFSEEKPDPRDDIENFNVPCLHILRKMRRRTEITFEGECSRIAACFKAETEAEEKASKETDEMGSEIENQVANQVLDETAEVQADNEG